MSLLKLPDFIRTQEVRALDKPVPDSIFRVCVLDEVEAVEVLGFRRNSWHRCDPYVAGKDDKIPRSGGAGGHQPPRGAIPVLNFDHGQWVWRRVVNRDLVGPGIAQPSPEPIVACYTSSIFFGLAGTAEPPPDQVEDSHQHGKSDSQPSKAVVEFEISEEITGRFQAARSRSGSETYKMWHPLTIA